MLDDQNIPKIELKKVTVAFGDKVVLDAVDLKIYPGESAVIIGGSGVGKSVLIKTILGLVPITSGEVLIDGQNLALMRKREEQRYREKMGILFQGGALFDSLPVWENVSFALLQNRTLSRYRAKEKAITMLQEVGLAPRLADLYPAELSGGMQKRVSMARTLMTEPEILLFDEPTSGLDPIMSDVINNLIVTSIHNHKATALTITHDMTSARKIADQIGMLYKGKLVWYGHSVELDQSCNPFVDQFIHGRSEGPIVIGNQ